MTSPYPKSTLGNLDLTSIVYGLAVAENCGFRQAATALGVNQSGLSRRIRALEDQLQASLFQRGSRGSRLTEAGERFLDKAREALSDLSYAAANLAASERGDAGRLRLGFYTPLSGGLLPTLIAHYRRDHPEVRIELRESSRRAALTSLREGGLDAAIVLGSGGTSGCETAELWSERVYAILPSNHPLAVCPEVSWTDLAHERFLTSQSECGAEVHDHILSHVDAFGLRPEVDRIAVSRDSLFSLVALGFGISLTAAAGTALPVAGVVFRLLTAPPDAVTFHAAWWPENGNPALRQFISLAHVLAGRPRKGTSDWTGKAA